MVEEDVPTGQSSFNHIGQCNDSNIKVEDVDGSDDGLVDYKSKYRNLKRKLKCLLYEQECFHEELRKLQRKCLRVNRDKSFLLDRLLQYEQPDISSDDEVTSSSEEDGESAKNLNLAKNRNKSSVTSKTQSSPKSVEKQSKATLNTIAGDKVRCRRIENGKQCPKLVSIKVKSGICYAHRQQLTGQKQGPSSKSGNTIKTSSPKSKSDKHPKQFTGGKDIGQIREAMEANALLESSSPGIYGEEEDDLVIDLPHQ